MILLAAISISLRGSTLIAAALAIVLVALAVLFYRYTLPPLPSRRRIMLSFLRALALVLLLLMLFEPLLRLIAHNDQKPVVVVLLDASQSMGMTDGAGNRGEAVRRFLGQKPLEKFPSSTEVQYILFSSKPTLPADAAPDSIAFRGEVTDLSEAFESVRNRQTTDNIQAVVLISDGNYTTGKNPSYSAEALGIPVFTVGVGDTVEQKDIVLENVTTNSIVYTETKVPVDVTVKSSGFGGQNVEVRLMEGATVLDHKVVALQEGTHEYSARLTAEPKEEGTKRYTVDVSRLSGELTEKNNVRSFFMKVVKSKVRIVLFAGAPSADVTAIGQVLSEDEQFSLRSFVQRAAGEFYGSAPSAPALDSADCFVFVGFPSAATSGSSLQQVAAIIAQKKKPLLFVGGKSIDYGKLQQVESILPFGWSAASQSEVEVFPSVPERQKNRPLVTFDGTLSAEVWQDLPPILKTQTSHRAKAESDVLAATRINNIVLTDPLVLTRSIAGQKSFAITGHGLWRWRLMAQGNAGTERFFSLLMTNAVRWLTTNEDEKRVRIVPVKDVFTTAEAVEFTGQVYDDQLHPADNAEVVVTLEHNNEKVEMALTPVGNGRYEGSLSGVAEGEYSYTGKAGINGTTVGEDKGRISVGQVNVEFLQTKMDKQLLEQLADRTGGRYANLADAGRLAGDIATAAKLAPKEIVRASEIELWNWQYVGAIVIILFGIEWLLRKRSGMI